MAPKKDKQDQNREGPQQPTLDMQKPTGETEDMKQLRAEVEQALRLAEDQSKAYSEAMGKVAALTDALQREKQRADAAEKERDALALDKGVLLGAQDEGMKAMRALQEKVDALTADLERLTAPAPELPISGWASERARELVNAVSVVDQPYLLGDLLAMLAPFAGEMGTNETATDTLQRKLSKIEEMRSVGKEMLQRFVLMEKQEAALREQVATLQAALVARRAPDATAEAEFSRVREALRGPALVFGLSGNVDWAAVAEQLAKEWRGLRTFFSEKPMVALAVKDESTPALADRYTLLLLQWDGKKLAPSTLEERMPWGDISPLLRQALASRLTPPQFRG